jgi:hypothetical protein
MLCLRLQRWCVATAGWAMLRACVGSGMATFCKRTLVLAAALGMASACHAHLCDNVFRQADKLIVKPENYNLVVKDQTSFKIFLQNNMDRGIAEISLEALSESFDFEIKPKVMSVPKDQRAFFQVTMKAKPETKTGNYPVSFRLVGGGRVFKSFVMDVAGASAGKSDAKPSTGAATSTVAQADKQQALPPREAFLKVGSITEPPLIDGSVDEPAWKTAAVFSNFSSSRGGRAAFDTVGLMAFDRQNMYFGFLCTDEKADGFTENDFIEITLSVNRFGTPAYILLVSPSGKVTMKKRLSAGQLSDWIATNIRFCPGSEGKAWTAELVIPFAAIDCKPPESAQKMFLRIVRSKASGNAEQSYWSAGSGGYNVEKGSGEITLVP